MSDQSMSSNPPLPARHAGQRPDGRVQLPGSLVAALVTPPIAWAIHQQASYFLASVHCPESSAWFHLLTVVLLAATSASAALVWTTRPTSMIAEDESTSALHLSRFLRVCGLASAALFGVAIIAQGLPPFIFLEPCQ